MKGGVRRFGAAERGLLPEGRLAGPMPWVIAIMMFLTVLAAAAGLGLAGAAGRLDDQLGSRITIQVVEADPVLRGRQAAAAAAAIRSLPGIIAVRPVPEGEIQALLEPWLGEGLMRSDLPVPALIDVDLTPEARARIDRLRQVVAAAAPAARVDDHAQWLAPLARLIGALQWLAAGLVLLMVGATAATVVLAARAALDTHRGTIEILHLMGATDLQVARLFQRRIALDALFGGLIGFILGGAVLVAIGDRVTALGSELLGSAAIPPEGWVVLIALPVFGVLLAMLVARLTILRALGRML
ncbi:ABC transporter permease [Sphingosinicella sp. CPCC 101087]|uniref:cell division protein FtsX n=1 Tax=Sphingosinicella sp. CPCC 101087 TaxID=2497754 RepID=UPI00101C32DA|nr:FtsX-like permease family protein [Sphingosinicella sp. CPCC 101087]